MADAPRPRRAQDTAILLRCNMISSGRNWNPQLLWYDLWKPNRADWQMIASTDQIGIGSAVRLKSGDQKMTVEAIFPGTGGALRVRCSWSDGTKRISQVFDLEAIVPARPLSTTQP
jgi:uncharacterized protein YodC (DUF2158 family)